MSETKTILHRFDCSAFDEELGFLDAMSEKGWQLADMRVFTQKYTRDDSVIYRYAIDYQKQPSKDEFRHYLAEYEDLGWIHVTKRGDWHVFRKAYDPSLPEAEYLLYSDEPSFRQMKNTVLFGSGALCIITLLRSLLQMNLLVLLLSLFFLFLFADSVFRHIRLRKSGRIPKPYRFHLWRYSSLLFLLLFVLGLAGVWGEHMVRDFQMEGPASGSQSAEFTIRMPDYYDLYASLSWPEDTSESASAPRPTFTLTDAGGRLVDCGLLEPGRTIKREFLGMGTYTLTVDWDADSVPGEAGTSDGTMYSLSLAPASFNVLDLFGMQLWGVILYQVLVLAVFAWGFIELIKSLG